MNEQDPATATPSTDEGFADAPPSSLTDDVAALIEDGQTYLTAELAYQKARLSFASAQGKAGGVLLLAAVGMVHLALIALVVGLVIVLAPVLTPLGATLVVAVALMVAALLFGLAARKRLTALSQAFRDDAP